MPLAVTTFVFMPLILYYLRMLEASGADIDPAIFQRDTKTGFEFVIGLTVGQLERTGEVIRLHDGFDPVAAGRGIVRELEDEGGETAKIVEELSEMIGEDFMSYAMSHISEEGEPPIPDEEYEEALKEREEAATALVDHIVGYHDFMRENLARAYGEGGEGVDEEAWTATWKKLKSTLEGVEGTFLAEAASFFDGLAREKFGAGFRHMEEDRGPAVNADVCARTFYKVMQDHVPRAIVGANRDEWTGYQ